MDPIVAGEPPSGPYAAALEFLYGRINYERSLRMPYGAGVLKLDRMRRLLEELGSPHQELNFVHVAGTKGKGSTSAMTAAVLTAAGYRTGLFSSPHLFRVEERVAIDGVSCSPERLAELVEIVRPVVEWLDAQGEESDLRSPTYFEVLTAMALVDFARQGVDAAVLEVGLGGRLDSTNVVTPRTALITSISYDHTRQLGNTLELIAREKAGIVKPQVPTVSGVGEPTARAAICEICRERRAPLIELNVEFKAEYHAPARLDLADQCPTIDFHYDDGAGKTHLADVELGLVGQHQAANAAVAIAALVQLRRQGWDLPEAAIRRGLAQVRWPARIEVISRQPTVVVDAAHNVASVVALLQALEESFVARRRTLLFATSSDKDAPGMLRELLPHFERVVMTRFLSNPRAQSPESLVACAAELGRSDCLAVADPLAAWRTARESLDPADLLCVTGSFFIAAEIQAEFNGRPIQIPGSLV
ncbi:MAG: bifunctional folylpolyglutamate synthase/dihydrofolate synthase [Pirellulales bacterium]|nr:bifunctional folylpolyglutamate synthase/dihydrofolate synthase [Pirellulales bacterium]